MGTASIDHRRSVKIHQRSKGRLVPNFNLKEQRVAAKMGMAVSLGALIASGFFKFQGARSIHIYSGFGLLAFTVWHHRINRSRLKSNR
jgi:uncharacterized membrane protein